MSLVLNGKIIDIDTKIQFRTLAVSDPNVWIGYVEGIVKFNVAKTVNDVVRDHNEVLKYEPGLDPVETLTFIIIATSDTADPSIRRAFAVDWIDESTVDVIDVTNHYDFRVFDIPEEDVVNVLQLLAENNFKTKLIT